MLNKYYVLVLSLNQSGGNSEEITRKDDYNSAESTYYDKCSNYAGNAATGYVVIQLLDTYGRPIKTATIDRLPEPEPTPEPSEE
jgi:hypothetical protein